MRGVFIVLAVSACAPLSPQPIDTSEWRIERNDEWKFALAVPPLWETMNWPSVKSKLIIRRQIASGQYLICHVGADVEPKTANTNQNALNSYMIWKGPPEPKTMSNVLNSTYPGRKIKYLSEKTIIVNGYVAYLSESTEAASPTSFGHDITESVYAVGKDYTVSCEAYSSDIGSLDKLFVEQLEIFRGVLASFVVLPVP